MLKKTITYFDFDNNERTETLYFNLSQSELIDLAMGLPEEVSSTVTGNPAEMNQEEMAIKLMQAIGGKGVIEFIKTLLLKSYGEKSEDGRRFIKSEAITNEFEQTIAFDTIFMELMSDDNAAAEFVNGIIPQKVIDGMPFMNAPKKVTKKATTKELPMK